MIEDARNKITELIERFDRNSEVYRSGNYNETQVRREFIDPFFDALGWDVANKAGYAEQYKDVVHEDSIKVGVSLKAPDYSFRIGGQRKFFLEAKKPQVKIKEDVGPAYQLRRYAWSAKLPLSIVTDFEEFAVYDCRVKPDPSDKVSHGRIAYYTYDQYLEKFDEIYQTFSKEAVLKGSFDRYIESSKGKKGTGEVDREFLKEIEKWRDSLARNLASRNPELDIYELNFAVQHTIDRIIFLRICEDRGIEGYNRLKAQLNGGRTYARLLQLFGEADRKYNSGLFDFRADKLSQNLDIDDKVLKDIIENLYYPKSPYEFSVIGAEILGNVYEQFLGKVIRLTAGHQAKVEEKPEVKKARGVYYTPQYIVEYIVKNTVGRIVGDMVDGCVGAALCGRPDLAMGQPGQKGNHTGIAPTNAQTKAITPKGVSKIRILDPACGSGSFLIGAYQYLLDWHLKWYRENEPEKHAKGKNPAIYQGAGKAWRLTTQEKKRILLNNIYGVDIDRQAVEVTKLSLLLKMLENENQNTISLAFSFAQERVLPSLEQNIKCGNSLIGPDFYSQMEMRLIVGAGLKPAPTMIDDDIRRINVFDWEKEFPEIMKYGGFDSVIGNPPYGATYNTEEKQYLDLNYGVSEGNYESFAFFLEKSIGLLNNIGLLGFIIPDTWFSIKSATKLRKSILESGFIQELQILNQHVFEKAKVDVCTVIFSKIKLRDDMSIVIFDKDAKGLDIKNNLYKAIKEIPQSQWQENSEYTFTFNIDLRMKRITQKITDAKPCLSDFCLVGAGCKPYERGKGTPPQTAKVMEEKPYTTDYKKDNTFRVMLRGVDISRYSSPEKDDEWLSYGEWLAAPRNPDLFNKPRLLFQSIRNPKLKRRLIGTYVDDDSVNNNSITNVIKLDNEYSLKYFLGILNSEMMNWYFSLSYNIVNIDPRYLKIAPIRTIDFNNPKDKALHDKMVSLVDRMLDLNKKLQAVKIAHEKELLERQIKITDDQIDRLVYELYGLTEEEIRVVEMK